MENPCRSCQRLKEPKNSEECMCCDKRFSYDDQIRRQPIGGELLKKPMEVSEMDTHVQKQAEEAPHLHPDEYPPEKPSSTEMPKCKNGCDKKVFAKGLCWKCYDTQRKAGKDRKENIHPKPKPKHESKPDQSKAFTVTIPDKLAQEIKAIAIKEYRTPESQVFYFLDVACQVSREAQK